MFMSDFISPDEIKHWKPYEKILVDAKTGAGKSYFALNILANYCIKSKKKMLILSNRNLLKEQNKEKNESGVDLLNYQFFEKQNQRKMTAMLLKYDMIVFDECHYFFQDSVFNAQTDKVLNYAIKKHRQIKIFISATPEPLLYLDIKFDHEYRMDKKYPYIRDIVIYDDINDVLVRLLEQPQKSLCFVSDVIEVCPFIFCHLDKVSFICSSGHVLARFIDKAELDNIIKESRFDKQMLITTTVLDNGINIIDNDVKNVLIDYSDPINIIQCFGRKRIKQGEKVTLYIKNPTQEQRYFKQKNTLTNIILNTYLADYYTKVDEVGFARYWQQYFKLKDGQIKEIKCYKDIVNFMTKHKDKPVAKKDLALLFAPYIEPKINRTSKSYNKFMQQNNIHFSIKITQKPTPEHGKIIEWEVKSQVI